MVLSAGLRMFARAQTSLPSASMFRLLNEKQDLSVPTEAADRKLSGVTRIQIQRNTYQLEPYAGRLGADVRQGQDAMERAPTRMQQRPVRPERADSAPSRAMRAPESRVSKLESKKETE